MLDFDGIVPEVWHAQFTPQQSAFCVRVCTHPHVACESDVAYILAQFSRFIEQLIRKVATHPVFELLQVSFVVMQAG